MGQVLGDCEGAIDISDDICVYGRTTAEHDRNLRKTKDTARKYGLVFNKDKCKIRQKQIKFYGHIWHENGFHPDPEKYDGIKSKPQPIIQKLQEFLGMIYYLSPFIPELSAKIAPHRFLLKKDTYYNWNYETYEKVFQNLKNSIHENLC